MNRFLHRFVGLLAALLMLWIAGTGTVMQLIDLKAIFTHEPATTPTELSMAEGMYGPGGYAVIQVSDFSAAALPRAFDINQAVATVLRAAHGVQGPGGPGTTFGPQTSSVNASPDPSRTGPGHRGGDGTGRPPAAGGSGDNDRPRNGPAGGGMRVAATTTAAGAAPASPGGGPGGGPAGGGRPQPRADDRVAAIDDAMPLTADQKTRIKAIYEVDQKKAAEIRATQDPDMRDKLAALRAEQNVEIEELLTADQKPKYEANIASAPQGGNGPGGSSGGGQDNTPMAWVELRAVDGVPIGQVMMGTKLEAFNALTGEAVTPVPPVALPQGRGLPPSLRQKLKTLHRFWNRGDTPGVYFEFLSGLILWLLLVTGLVMYFRLLNTRVKQGRRQLLWLTGGGWWRGLHRVISVLAAAFIICIAFSGTWIGFESSASALRRSGGGPPPAPGAGQQRQPGALAGQPGAGGGAGARGRRNPIDFIIPLRDVEVQDMTATTLSAMQELHPNLPIKAIRLRIYGQMKQGVVITGGDETNQFVFNADTGRTASLSEQGYPESGFPFGVQVHENIKHFHSGAMFGISTRLMSLFAGFSLTFLSISGLVIYFDMWLKRRKANRNSLVWR